MITEKFADFASAADTYCRWAEGEPQDAVQDVRTARLLLSELILRAIRLPDISLDKTPSEISNDQFQKVYDRFSSFPFQQYSEYFDPLANPPEEPAMTDLADALADVWKDLRHGLDLYQAGKSEEALWEWRYRFSAHWGRHATGTLFSLQSWFARNVDHTEAYE